MKTRKFLSYLTLLVIGALGGIVGAVVYINPHKRLTESKTNE
jgi:hypothetical protein